MKFQGRLAALAISVLTAAPAWAQSTWGPTSKAGTVVTLVPAPPATLAGNASYTSGCTEMLSRGFTVFAALSAVGTLSVQRYADTACTLPVGTGQSTDPSTPLTLTTGGGCPAGSFCGAIGANDLYVYMALVVTLTDTSGSTNTVVSLAPRIGVE